VKDTTREENDKAPPGDEAQAVPLGRLGARLFELRRARGMSQHQVASALNVADSSYAGWERAEFGPRFEQLIAMADLFDVTLDDLVGRQSEQASAFSREGVSWRLAWSRPSSEKQQAAAIWEQLMAGRRRGEVARALKIGEDEVDRRVQDLVLEEWLEIDEVERRGDLEERIRERFLDDRGDPRLREVRVARIGHIDSLYARYVLLGHVAKSFLGTRDRHGALRAGMSLGLCGGFSVSRLVYAYRRGELPAGIRVAPIAVTPVFERAGVSANSVVGALAYRHYDDGVEATELSFLTNDSPGTAGRSGSPISPAWRIAKRALDDAARVDVAVLGLGAPGRGALARDITEMQRDFQWLARVADLSEGEQADDAVGNILYQLIDALGEPQFQVHTQGLVCSIGLDGLRGMVDTGRRVIVLGVSSAKAGIARAAVLGGYVNVLMIDDALAEALLEVDT
jgi:DNA-binding transcriptional regulator LsrR (DeoR family)/DNA-binding XRE family transcriptional regulator